MRICENKFNRKQVANRVNAKPNGRSSTNVKKHNSKQNKTNEENDIIIRMGDDYGELITPNTINKILG